jgi:cytoskeleton protein RodZ
LGLRLRNARIAQGLSVAEVAEKLRLKAVTVEALECENMQALGAPVYVRGYYTSYARLVQIPAVLVEDRFATQLTAAPRLHTTAHVSHSRYLIDRYAKRVVYVVLTASIVLPVILLATRNQLPQPGAVLTSLDEPVASSWLAGQESPGRGGQVVEPAADSRSTPVASRSTAENTVVASMTPFYSSPAAVGAQPGVGSDISPAVSVDESEAASLSLRFSAESWVEVIARNGEKLESGNLKAGESRRFELADVARVSLGNAEAVEVRMNGDLTDISPYRRANVARFTVSSEGELAAAGG